MGAAFGDFGDGGWVLVVLGDPVGGVEVAGFVEGGAGGFAAAFVPVELSADGAQFGEGGLVGGGEVGEGVAVGGGDGGDGFADGVLSRSWMMSVPPS